MEEARNLSRALQERLKNGECSLATAESCTGGLLGHLITAIPGSSAYFWGGVISYNNDVKHRILGVRQETLETKGAVSAECAREMAQGIRRLTRADIGISITGIAGPTGATPEKPLGLTYIHLSTADCEYGEVFIWHGTRSENKLASAKAALRLILKYLNADICSRSLRGE